VTFWQAITSCYSKYATFSGRASRSEYWYFTLYHTLLVACFALMPSVLGTMLLALSLIGNFLPALSVLVRRLHDTDRSGWWYWIALVPLLGLILIIWFCTRGTAGDNRFGADPLADGALRTPAAQQA
jgi:uncharacterized membrane protein YhaH (DUF805 family)